MGLKMAVPNSLARPGVCTSLTRPVNPFEGQVIYETDTDDTLVWNGSSWLNLHFASFDAKGNLFVGTGASTGANLAVGADDSVLVADSTASEGVAWSNSLTLSSLDVTGVVNASEVTGIISGQISITVENNTGSPLGKASPVYVNGFGTSHPTVDLAESDLPDGAFVLGLLAEQIANSSTGECVLYGLISGVDTSTYTVNKQLFVTDSGSLTDVLPLGSADRIQPIGRVIRSDASNGQILCTAGIPEVVSPNSINVSGALETSSSVRAASANFTGGIEAVVVEATNYVSAPDVTVTNSLTINGIEVDTNDAQIDEVLVFNGTKFAPANIDTGGKSFAYFMGA
jgi:hypothetical protein